MLGVGQKFPEFARTGVVANELDKAVRRFDGKSIRGKWAIGFFWPRPPTSARCRRGRA